MKRRKFIAAWVVCGLALVAQSGDTYKARLSAAAADGKSRASLAGIGNAMAVLAGSKLTITGTFEGLRTAATVARLHNAVAGGVRGPAMQDLTISKATNGTISGSADLTQQQLQNLRKGGLYIQIHSEAAPDGVLWGWLMK